jgi:hypothetical protein
MILSSGIDSIYLSVCATLHEPEKIYSYLADLKKKSVELNEDQVGSFDENFFFKVHKTGSKGYEYVLLSNEYCFKIMKTQSSIIPNILIEIRSEKLWGIGLKESVKEALKIINAIVTRVDWVKISRIDLCCDYLMKKQDWNLDILKKKVTRAKKKQIYLDEADELTGISIGSGPLMLRMYDKEKEIIKSGKEWFYEIWKIEKGTVPEDSLILRIEFQVRRDILKEFCISEIDDVYEALNALWAYFTKEWFKILKVNGITQKNNKDRQEIETYWEVIQSTTFNNEYKEIKRIKNAIGEIDVKKISKRIISQLAHLMAAEIYLLDLERKPMFANYNHNDAIMVLEREIPRIIKPEEFWGKVKKWLIQYDRVREYTDEVPF